MARSFISNLQPGEMIDNQTFLVASKDLRTTTQGSLYIHAVLADKTGQILGRVWNASEPMYKVLPEGGFVNLKGRVESYKGNMQFIVEAIRPIDEADVDLGDFLPETEHNIDEMYARVSAILDGIKDPHVAAIVNAFRGDDERMTAFRKAPAAVTLHHAYIGGLLEHTLSMLELALLIIPRYPKLKIDLVLAGIFLHDLGKTVELSHRTNFHYSDQGQLIGHIAICTVWIEQMAVKASETLGRPIPENIKWALQHIVLSHHAKPEFGSPRYPAIPEALAIHYIDNIDAKLNMSVSAIENDKDPASHWTSYMHALDTKLFKVDVLSDNG